MSLERIHVALRHATTTAVVVAIARRLAVPYDERARSRRFVVGSSVPLFTVLCEYSIRIFVGIKHTNYSLSFLYPLLVPMIVHWNSFYAVGSPLLDSWFPLLRDE